MRARTIVAATVVVLAAACETVSDEPVDAALVELVEDQDAFDGRVVVTEGVVRRYDDPRHHWIEDADQHRVEIEPQELVADHVGDRVRVTGRFVFLEDQGRVLEADAVEMVGEGDAGKL